MIIKLNTLYFHLLAIEPEILPKGSTDGEGALAVFPKWIEYSIILILILIIGSILKLFYTFILMVLGVTFVWKLAISRIKDKN